MTELNLGHRRDLSDLTSLKIDNFLGCYCKDIFGNFFILAKTRSGLYSGVVNERKTINEESNILLLRNFKDAKNNPEAPPTNSILTKGMPLVLRDPKFHDTFIYQNIQESLSWGVYDFISGYIDEKEILEGLKEIPGLNKYAIWLESEFARLKIGV